VKRDIQIFPNLIEYLFFAICFTDINLSDIIFFHQCHDSSCGGATIESRHAVCSTKSGSLRPEAECDVISKPSLSRDCPDATKSRICRHKPRWFASQWSEVRIVFLNLLSYYFYWNIILKIGLNCLMCMRFKISQYVISSDINYIFWWRLLLTMILRI